MTRASDRKTYTVWRPDHGNEESGRDYDAIDPDMAAEMAAERDHSQDGWEWEWPVVYHVRLCESDRVWAVEVEREMVPEFVGGKALPIPMPPAVHVLWGSRVVCEDIRLRGVPASWPEGQTWISLARFQEHPEDLASVTCTTCARRAPGIVAGLQAIEVKL